jgi:hypothetical protein
MHSSPAAVRRLLRGYLKGGDRLFERHNLAIDDDTILGIVGRQPDDPELLDSYPLSAEQAGCLATLAGVTINLARLDYYLEAVSV